MSSENMGLAPSQGSHHRHHLVFQDDNPLRFNCGAPAAAQLRVGGGDAAGVPKTRDLSGFIDERFFAPPTAAPEFRRGVYGGERSEPRSWNGNEAASLDGSEEDEEDEDEEDEDEEVDGKGDDSNNVSNGDDKIGSGNGKQKQPNNNNNNHHHHHFGSSSRDVVAKESGGILVAVAKVVSPSQLGGYNSSQNAVTVAENNGGGGGGDGYYSQYFHGVEGSSKDLGVENGCGFSGRKESCLYLSESGESLRTILSDPMTGALMDDAMILPCGHSFGGGGIQHVIRMKSCYSCSQSISDDSIAPNLSLRAAVQAFRREEELQIHRSAKRKRERFDQDKGVYGDSFMELPRSRGVQFPFAVTDRVIIKGNKRTPQRFVGREAVVTTQCLNGWYVVKTLDNAESVKLQYRSLAKVPEDPLSKPMTSKMAPNWL